jgi:hypothetical protein
MPPPLRLREDAKMRFSVILATVVTVACFLVHQSASASCADDLQRLQAQGKQHPNQGDRKTYSKELKEAQQLVGGQEAECLNAVARARRALNASPSQSEPVGPVQPVAPLNQQ